ncbi:unnamed protein product [Choristocarpus tenellus]|uniref:hypothetical protein n=1 Tax=Choristocarpus tenellus TaxID=116065 RepID=UPI002E77503E|nr:hypothetical protein V2478_pgp080 [Choristocarpus tenellus]WAM62335.1 hypothetical protein [Choristocarpus tenellus]
MNFFFPLIYSIILFLILIIIGFYTIQQIINIQKTENQIINLRKKIQNNQNNYENNYKLGKLYLKKKIFNKAILFFRQSLKNWNLNDKISLSSLYNILGFTYFNLKQYNFAIYYYKISLQLLPDYILALNNLGFVYEKINLFEEAFNCYETILKYDKINKVALSRKTYITQKLKNIV